MAGHVFFEANEFFNIRMKTAVLLPCTTVCTNCCSLRQLWEAAVVWCAALCRCWSCKDSLLGLICSFALGGWHLPSRERISSNLLSACCCSKFKILANLWSSPALRIRDYLQFLLNARSKRSCTWWQESHYECACSTQHPWGGEAAGQDLHPRY